MPATGMQTVSTLKGKGEYLIQKLVLKDNRGGSNIKKLVPSMHTPLHVIAYDGLPSSVKQTLVSMCSKVASSRRPVSPHEVYWVCSDSHIFVPKN